MWGLTGLAVNLLCSGCTTTLDPTTLETGPSDPEPIDPPVGCAEEDGMAGATFSSCVELEPCSSVGQEEDYLLCSHTLSYEAASHECRLRGGYLAEVNSEAENRLLADAANQTVGTNVWLGGKRSETFVWAWEQSQIVFWRGERDGTPEENVFVVWQADEPNNSSTVSDEPEKCLALTSEDADWNDRACSLDLPFACEIR